MKALLISLILPFSLALVACGDKVETYEIMSLDPVVAPPAPPPPPPPAPDFGRQSESGELNSNNFNPKLEIFFVIDNSTSMEDEINKVSKNINTFVDAFTKNMPFPYNVAVTSVYDHRRFRSQKFKDRFGGTEFEFDVGEFRPVRDGKGRVIEGKNYISHTDSDIKAKLKNTLKIGIQSLQGAGPEVEESFTPISAAYGFGPLKQKAETIERQKGFFMGPDSYKVSFFVTDASDNSTISADSLYWNLVARSNGDRSKVMGFGAISTGNCSRDPGVQNSKIEEFLSQSRPEPNSRNVVSLCADFGRQFAQFGRTIRRKILDQSIPLKKGIPDFSNPNAGDANECMKPAEERSKEAILVCYGDQRIFLRTTDNGPRGYQFNPGNNSISLDPGLKFEAQSEVGIEVEYTPIHPDSRKKGHVKAWGK